MRTDAAAPHGVGGRRRLVDATRRKWGNYTGSSHAGRSARGATRFGVRIARVAVPSLIREGASLRHGGHAVLLLDGHGGSFGDSLL